MKTNREHIEYWLFNAIDDWEAVQALFAVKKYLQALFFAHLVIEKLCKAAWIRDNESNIPPKSHNLVFILSKTKLELSEQQSEFLLELNRFQLEGRYPDYISQMQKICNDEFTLNVLRKAEGIKQWLQTVLQ